MSDSTPSNLPHVRGNPLSWPLIVVSQPGNILNLADRNLGQLCARLLQDWQIRHEAFWTQGCDFDIQFFFQGS